MAPSKILNYSEEAMVNALKAVANGSSFCKAARNYGVPKTTLLYKYTGKYPLKRQMGPPTILSTDEEEQLSNWVIHCGDNGFPINKTHLIDSVEMLLNAAKRITAFPDNRPGRAWYDRFIERNHISERMTQNLNKARSSVTEAGIRNWLQEVENYLQATNSMDILADPTRVFNMDETAFFMTPKGDKVLVKKGTKVVYSFAHNDEKECTTVFLGSNAAGTLVPPCVVFAYIRLPPRLVQSVPSGWGIGKSESGWMTAELFFEYMANVFHPWLIKNSIQLPVILFVDGHTSHASLPLGEFCSKNGIILVSLHPNATHIYQPMDIGLNHSLKLRWKQKVRKYRMDKNGEKIKKEDFCKLLSAVLTETDPNILRNSFVASGLYPFNADAIKYSELIKDTIANSKSSETNGVVNYQQVSASYCRRHLDFIEKLMDADTLIKFKCCGDIWNGLPEDANLFKLWYNAVKMTIETNTPSPEDNLNSNVETNTLSPEDNLQGTVIASCTADNEIIINEDEDVGDMFMDWNLCGDAVDVSESIHEEHYLFANQHSTLFNAPGIDETNMLPTSSQNQFDEKQQKLPAKDIFDDFRIQLPETKKERFPSKKIPKRLEEYFEHFREKQEYDNKSEEEKRRRKQVRYQKQKRYGKEDRLLPTSPIEKGCSFEGHHQRYTEEQLIPENIPALPTNESTLFSLILDEISKSSDSNNVAEVQMETTYLSTISTTATSSTMMEGARNSSDSNIGNDNQNSTTDVSITNTLATPPTVIEGAHTTSDSNTVNDNQKGSTDVSITSTTATPLTVMEEVHKSSNNIAIDQKQSTDLVTSPPTNSLTVIKGAQSSNSTKIDAGENQITERKSSGGRIKRKMI